MSFTQTKMHSLLDLRTWSKEERTPVPSNEGVLGFHGNSYKRSSGPMGRKRKPAQGRAACQNQTHECYRKQLKLKRRSAPTGRYTKLGLYTAYRPIDRCSDNEHVSQTKGLYVKVSEHAIMFHEMPLKGFIKARQWPLKGFLKASARPGKGFKMTFI